MAAKCSTTRRRLAAAERSAAAFRGIHARNRAGLSIAALTPKEAIRSGNGSPRTSAAQPSPIAAEVWMP